MKLLASLALSFGLVGSSVGSCDCTHGGPKQTDVGGSVPRPGADVGSDRKEQPIDSAAAAAVTKRLAAAEASRLLLAKALPFRDFDDLRIPFGGSPPAGTCVDPPPAPAIDVHRSLFVHDLATLDHVGPTHDFSLRHTLDRLATQIAAAGVTGMNSDRLFRAFWDTQNDSSSAVTPGGAHCDDDGSTINGFPNSCPRAEGSQATNPAADLDSYVPIALVNRLDLADQGWRNCGEHRVVYAKTTGPGRNLMIFEAVLPNPSPGCQDGCRPVAEFWAELSTDPVATSRAEKLQSFYYDGLPGFRPVVHVDHYSSTGAPSGYGSAGGGQIRTNQFMQSPWTLKEMRTVIDCDGATCEFQFVPDTVKLNPFGGLWNPSVPATDFGGRVGSFRAAIAAQVSAIGAAHDVNALSYELLDDFNGAQSNAQSATGDTAYCSHFGCSADHYLASAMTVFNAGQPTIDQLTARQVVNRATALSCGGCHQPSVFGLTQPEALGASGAGLERWPSSAGFVHTDETTEVPMPDPALFGGANGFRISPALELEFLPARRANLEAFLAQPDCPCLLAVFPRLPVELLRTLDEFIPRPDPRLDPLTRSLRLHAADRSLERRTVEGAAEAEVKVKVPVRETTSLAPTVERLRATKGIEDPAKRALARSAAIRERVAEQPPRRTVDGTFRVH